MAYAKTTWQTGDVITAAKLNNAENQIEKLTPAVITATFEANVITLGSTWQEIKALFDAGQTLVIGAVPNFVMAVDEEEGEYIVIAHGPHMVNGHLENDTYFITDTATGYPAFES